MKKKFSRQAGTALIVSTVILVVTMVLHPAGGNIDYIIKISSVIVVSHSLALLSLPVCLFGFWGLSAHFQKEWILSRLAMIVMLFALFAGMCAAAINGLALPMFVGKFKDSTPQILESVKTDITYNTILNHAFDFIFITAICISMILWSIAILRKKELPAWFGYYGIIIGISFVIMLLSGFVLVSLHGFRIFVFAIVSWILLAGFLLRQPAESTIAETSI